MVIASPISVPPHSHSIPESVGGRRSTAKTIARALWITSLFVENALAASNKSHEDGMGLSSWDGRHVHSGHELHRVWHAGVVRSASVNQGTPRAKTGRATLSLLGGRNGSLLLTLETHLSVC